MRGTWFIALCVLNMLDAALTVIGLGGGLMTEGNPLMAALYGFHPLAFVLAKLVFVNVAITWLAMNRHEALARYAVYGLTAAYAAVVIWNTTLLTLAA